VLVYMVWALPFVLWMLQSYVRGIPRELEEAATRRRGDAGFQILTGIDRAAAAPGHRRHDPVRVHHSLERVLPRARVAPEPRPDDAAARLAQFVGIEGIVRSARSPQPAARDHPEPRSLHRHPALAHARAALGAVKG
jgi:multiple sugar transport system permease protein